MFSNILRNNCDWLTLKPILSALIWYLLSPTTAFPILYHRMVWVGRDLKDRLVPTMEQVGTAMGRDTFH